jgi:hypothetical protein
VNVGESNAAATVLGALGYPDRHPRNDDQIADALVLLGESAGKRLQLSYPEQAIRAGYALYLAERAELDAAVYQLVEIAEQRARGWEGVSEDWPVERREAAADAVRRHEERDFCEGDNRMPEAELRWWVGC